MNKLISPEEYQPKLIKNHEQLNGYVRSETVVLLMSGGLKGEYLDFGNLIGTVAPDGSIITNWTAQASSGNIGQFVIGWYPIPVIPQVKETNCIYKALVSYEVANLAMTTCTFKNMDGVIFTKTLPVTIFNIAKWLLGVSIQDAMPSLSASERELFLTGMSQEDWDALLQDSEE